VLLALVLAGCSMTPSENSGIPRPPEVRATAAPKSPAGESKAAGEEPKAAPTDRTGPAARAGQPVAKGADAKPDPKIRRVEDLPPAAPVAFRPLRVEELPEAPSASGRSRRAKEASAGGAADPKRKTLAAGVAPGQPLRVEDLPSVSAAVRPLRTDELSPELVKRADDLLWNHPSPVGVDIPLEVNGKSYVARFAYHYHEFGSAKKPWGYHKGVTLYSTER
jgi:hypothetical protein